jgi:antitoxin component YwqK of YwqJK toxin-antitoxin module
MKKYFILLFLLFPTALFAQKAANYGINKVHIVDQDKIIQAELLPDSSQPAKKVTLFYYWYSSNHIYETQGSYSGQLLNGTYNEYFIDRSLKVQGQFKNGLKDGIWRRWDDKGIMTELYTWKKGVKDGSYMLFDEKGNIREAGKYKQGVFVKPDSISFWKRVKQTVKKKI